MHYELLIFILVFLFAFLSGARFSNFLAFTYGGIFKGYRDYIRKVCEHEFYYHTVGENDFDLVEEGYEIGAEILQERHSFLYPVLVGCSYCQNIWITWAIWGFSLIALSAYGYGFPAFLVVASFPLIAGFSHSELERING